MSINIDPRLCILRVFKEYIKLTEKLRQSPQLLVSYKKPFASVTMDTVSRWVLSVLKKAGVDTAKYGSHSTRGASTSARARSGLSVNVLMKHGCWKGAPAMARHYNKPVEKEPQVSVASNYFRGLTCSVREHCICKDQGWLVEFVSL